MGLYIRRFEPACRDQSPEHFNHFSLPSCTLGHSGPTPMTRQKQKTRPDPTLCLDVSATVSLYRAMAAYTQHGVPGEDNRVTAGQTLWYNLQEGERR